MNHYTLKLFILKGMHTSLSLQPCAVVELFHFIQLGIDQGKAIVWLIVSFIACSISTGMVCVVLIGTDRAP